MNVSCPNCEKDYTIADSKIPDAGASFKCKNCNAVIKVQKESISKPPQGEIEGHTKEYDDSHVHESEMVKVNAESTNTKIDNRKTETKDQIYYLKAIYRGVGVLVFFKLLEFVFQFAFGTGAIRF